MSATLRLAHSGPGVPGAVRPGKSHVAIRPLPATTPYDRERDIEPLEAQTAVAALVALHRSEMVAELITLARGKNPALANLLAGYVTASEVLCTAAQTRRVVVLTDSQVVVDARHPSMADDCPPRGIRRPQ